MQRGNHTAMQSPQFTGHAVDFAPFEIDFVYISRWEGISSGRFTGLRGANDLRKIPYIKPIKVKGLP